MDQKIKDLWNNNRIVFFLCIPLIALYFARNWLISLLVASGNKVVGDTTAQSDVLKQDEAVANTKADQIIADADKQAANKPAVDENWDQKK